ncbi:hypothetical protein ABTL85_19055, partial [Acinetobacter baumannii]
EANAAAAAEMVKTCEPEFTRLIDATTELTDRAVREAGQESDALVAASASSALYTYTALFGSTLLVLALAVIVTVTNITAPLKVLVTAMARM